MSKQANDPVHDGMTPADAAAEARGIVVDFGYMRFVQSGDETLWATVNIDRDAVIRFLHASARHHLKPGTRYEIRERAEGVRGVSSEKGLAWYYHPAFNAAKEWDCVPLEPIRRGQDFLVGEYTTPGPKLP